MALKYYLSVLALTALLVLAISTEVFAAVSGLAATALLQLFAIATMTAFILMEAKYQTGEYETDIMLFSLIELVIAYSSFVEGAYGVASLIASVSAFTFAVGFVMYVAEMYERKKRLKEAIKAAKAKTKNGKSS